MAYPKKQSEGAMGSGSKSYGDGYSSMSKGATRPSASSKGATVKESKLNKNESYAKARKGGGHWC